MKISPKLKRTINANRQLFIGLATGIMLIVPLGLYLNHTNSSRVEKQSIERPTATPPTDADKADTSTPDPTPVPQPASMQTRMSQQDIVQINETQRQIDERSKEIAESIRCGDLNTQHWANYQYARDITIQATYETNIAKMESDYQNGHINLAQLISMTESEQLIRRNAAAAALSSFNQIMTNAGCSYYVQ